MRPRRGYSKGMSSEHLTEALTTATKALHAAQCCCDEGEAIDALAQALATDDRLAGAILAHLSTDLDRATTIAWDSGYHLAKALAHQDAQLG